MLDKALDLVKKSFTEDEYNSLTEGQRDAVLQKALDLSKGKKVPVGTIRGNMIKTADGKWSYNKKGRGDKSSSDEKKPAPSKTSPEDKSKNLKEMASMSAAGGDSESAMKFAKMSESSPKKSTSDKSPKQIIEGVFSALKDQGIHIGSSKILDKFHPPEMMDSTTQNITKNKDGSLSLRLTIDGETSGLEYSLYKKVDSEGEVRNMHDPINPDSLHNKIKSAVESQGMKVEKVTSSGHQMHWDHDVHYTVKLKAPVQKG